MFSDLNQLTDISMLPQYATLCGLTHGELERDFNPEIGRLEEQEGVDREEILRRLTRMYDGYHFSENTEGYSILSVCCMCCNTAVLTAIGFRLERLLFWWSCCSIVITTFGN